MDKEYKFWYYALLGFLPPFIQSLSELTADKMASMLWPQWTVLILMPMYSMLLGLKALISSPPSMSPKEVKDPTVNTNVE